MKHNLAVLSILCTLPIFSHAQSVHSGSRILAGTASKITPGPTDLTAAVASPPAPPLVDIASPNVSEYLLENSQGIAIVPVGGGASLTCAACSENGEGATDFAADARGNFIVASGNLALVPSSNNCGRPDCSSSIAASDGANFFSVAVDTAGSYIVADNENHQILRIAPGSNCVSLGNCPSITYATKGQSSEDVYVRVDNAGNYIVAEDNGDDFSISVFVIPPSTLASPNPAAAWNPIPLTLPSSIVQTEIGGLTLDASGNYLITDFDNGMIYTVTPSGVFSVLFSDANYILFDPEGVFFDPVSKTYLVVDNTQGTLFSMNPTATQFTPVVSNVDADLVSALSLPTTLTITTLSLPVGTVNLQYAADLNAQGGSGNYSWSASGLPPGLTLSSGTGVISGTPAAATTTPLSVTVTATDVNDGSLTATRTLPLTIVSTVASQPLSITTTSIAGTAGTALSKALTATGGSGTYTWSATGTPPGLTLSSAGLLTGTPTQPGSNFSFRVTVTDANISGLSMTASIPVTIANIPLSITTTTLPGGIAGVGYGPVTMLALGGSGVFTWSATGLPAHLAMSTAGVISGIPLTAVSGASVTVTVTDSVTQSSVSQTYSISIVPSIQISTLACSPSSLGPAAASVCTVTLTQAAPTGGSTVTLASSNVLLTVPASVTVTAGATTATFKVTAATSIANNQSVAVAAILGASSQTASITLVSPVLLSGLACNSSSLSQSAASTCTVTLASVAPTGGSAVTLSSNNGLLTVPASVTVAAGATTVTFTASAAATIANTQSATVTATLNISVKSVAISLVGSSTAGSSGSVTNVTTSANPSAVGQSIILTATVTPLTATGTVTFKDGSTILGTSPSANGTAVLAVSTLSAGSHLLTAVYGGNTNFSANTLPGVTQVVNQVATSITLSSSAKFSFLGQNVTLTATVTPSTATGTVAFKDGSTTLGTGALNNGTASLVLSAPSVGSHSLTAIYGGDVNYAASVSSVLAQIVNPIGLTITTSALPGGIVGTIYSQILTASGGTPPYNNWVLNSGMLPPGLTLNASTGTISGNPTTSVGNPFNFTVIVKDSTGGMSAPQGLAISTSQPSGLIIMTASPLPPGTVGVPYTQAFEAASGATPYRNWAVTAGSIPPGTSLDTTNAFPAAVLTGTPTVPGTYTFTLQVTDSVNATATKQFSLTINSPGTISISLNGIVNAASYAGGGVAPGEIVAIFGSGIGPNSLVSLQVSVNGTLATTLSGVQVLFDGIPAPLIYVLSTQISAVVPYEVSGKSSTQVQVSYQGQKSDVVTVPVVTSAPGIFSLDGSGSGAGAILNQDGTVNSTGNPAASDSIIVLYATGAGQTNPGGVDGELDGSPAPAPVQPVTATVGGLPATVIYAGGVSGLVAGVIQVNLRLPTGVPTGNAVPVTLNVGGANSQTGATAAILPAAQPTGFGGK